MTAGTGITAAQLRQWLVERVSGYLEIPVDQVDVDTPLAEIGLDSVYAMTLSGDVEDAFGIEVEPTIAWDHPTIAALSAGLLDLLRDTGEPR